MSQHSEIEWTDATWNPVRGCTKISPGCTHCYAETFAERFRGVPGHPYEQGFDLRLVPEKLVEPLRWQTPKMIFVNSMSDLFHKDVPDDYVLNVVRVMQTANWHTYQVLTKRSERLRDMLQTSLATAAAEPHIWWGVSVENRRHGLPRIDHLRAAPARVRFLSIEPLLEDLGEINLEGIHWVIVGGESGAGARPMEMEWVLSIRDQCERAGLRFFFKQWGGVRKSKAGRELDGKTYDAQPGRVELPVLDRPRRLAAIAEIERLYQPVAAPPAPVLFQAGTNTHEQLSSPPANPA
jgi:protein gp37